MPEPKIAQKGPYPVEVEASKTYFWCACGRSANQPFCDGSHKGSEFTPMKYEAAESKTVYFCGCKHTATPVLLRRDARAALMTRSGYACAAGARAWASGRVLAGRGEDGVQDGAFHARHELDHAGVADVLDEAVDDLVAQFAVGHLAAAEAQARLHLVALGQEADRLVLLGLVVVLVHGDRELDFLEGDDLLLLARGALALFLLVEKAAVVLDAADGRNGVGRNFNQIEAALAGDSAAPRRAAGFPVVRRFRR